MGWLRFVFFILVFLLLWGLMHYGVYLSVSHFLGLSQGARLYLGLAIFLLFLSFPLFRLLSRFLPPWLSFPLNFLSDLWIGMVFYAFLFSLIGVVLHLILKTLISGETIGWGIVILTILTMLYGYVEANRIRIRRLSLKISGLKAKQVRIVFMADLHLGVNLNFQKLRGALEAINSFSPDFVLIAGDLLDEEPGKAGKYAEIFSKIKAQEIFAVTGNHEFYAGGKRAVEFFRHSGITLLRNTVKDLAPFEIAGVDDEEFLKGKWEGNLMETLKKAGGEKPLILLKHRPTGFDIAREMGVSLMLCGHTHRAPLFPLHFITSKIYRYFYGYHREGKMHIYITSGVGTWGPPLRVLAPPEIVFITLNP